MKNQQSGFTLVELVVVIVILGILSATALPKFINVSKDARISALNGVAGALRSGVSLVQAKYFATGNSTATTVLLQDGVTTVAVAAGTGIPTTTGILSAVSLDGFPTPTTSGTVVTFQPTGGSATCQVTYNAATGVVSTPSIGGC